MAREAEADQFGKRRSDGGADGGFAGIAGEVFKQHIAIDFGFGRQAGLDGLPGSKPIGDFFGG